MIEIEMLVLIGLVAIILLVVVYAWMTHSPAFERLVKALEYKGTQEERKAAERKEAEEQRKTVAAIRNKKYEA